MDTSVRYELRYFDAGWDVKRIDFDFTAWSHLDIRTIRFSGQVDSNAVEPKPNRNPLKTDSLRIARREVETIPEGGRNTSSAWRVVVFRRGGVGKRSKMVCIEIVLCQSQGKDKWYDGVFKKSIFLNVPRSICSSVRL